MALPNFAKHTINVVRAGLKTMRGAEVQDWSQATEFAIPGCFVQPRSTSSDKAADRVAQATDSYTVHLPPTADLRRGDRVKYDGITFDVNGFAPFQPSVTGRLDYKVATIVVHEG